ncbi:MAG: WecB/TagA/CpsF family glycosyltransferase [Ignavibacteriales bacterium]|nr:WecB/TagA/CpsF family glycosyltransferase [Ignavibacteriales bacterium]MCB9209109.1 WecB/TagA/CpsF family glycosyltransferase [Ignavibacteriales bacterium]MCB9260359.1 WecB/TagA/CpsF family glycosyltransferase [Ignavibacteriales bacterium]
MIFSLKYFPKIEFSKNQKKTIIYADFNVLLYLFKNNLKIPSSIILYPDSTLVNFSLRILNRNNLYRYVSTDIQNSLLTQIDTQSKKVFFFGDSSEVLMKLISNVQNEFKRINVVGTQNGYYFKTDKVIEKINNLSPDVLFIGLGIGIQEKWIFENYNKINANVILSVGGWFQYLAGCKLRAPKLMRKYHLEWLHKFLNEFNRIWKRYLIDAPEFLIRVFVTKQIKFKINSE